MSNKVNLTLDKYTELIETINQQQETIAALETIINEEVRSKGYIIKLNNEVYTTDEVIIEQEKLIKILRNEITRYKEESSKGFWCRLFETKPRG